MGPKPEHTAMYYNSHGKMAAMVLSKHHYQRKAIFLSMRKYHMWKLRYTYERIFGFETKRGEAYEHPSKWGLNPSATYYTGWVTGGLLRKYTADSLPDITEYRVQNYISPFKTWKDRKFHLTRFRARRFKNSSWYTYYDEYLHPKMEEARWLIDYQADQHTEGKWLPMWMDIHEILENNRTYGAFTRGMAPREAAKALIRFCFSRDPIGTYKRGGAIVTTPFHKGPSLSGIDQDLYTALLQTKEIKEENYKRIPSTIVPKITETIETNSNLDEQIRELLFTDTVNKLSDLIQQEDKVVQELESLELGVPIESDEFNPIQEESSLYEEDSWID